MDFTKIKIIAKRFAVFFLLPILSCAFLTWLILFLDPTMLDTIHRYISSSMFAAAIICGIGNYYNVRSVYTICLLIMVAGMGSVMGLMFISSHLWYLYTMAPLAVFVAFVMITEDYIKYDTVR